MHKYIIKNYQDIKQNQNLASDGSLFFHNKKESKLKLRGFSDTIKYL